MNYLNSYDDNGHVSIAHQISETVFLVRSKLSPASPIGWSHVYIINGSVSCGLGSSCTRKSIKTGKRDTVMMKCLHEALVSCMMERSQIRCSSCQKYILGLGCRCKHCPNLKYCNRTCQEAHWPEHEEDCKLSLNYIEMSASYLFDTLHLPEKSVIAEKIQTYSSAETLNIEDKKWPRYFLPSRTHCPTCKELLEAPTKKSLNGRKSMIITLDKLIQVDILQRKCKSCRLLIYPDTVEEYGLLCVGGIYLLSLDLLFSMESRVKRGMPPSTAASSIVEDIDHRNKLYYTSNKADGEHLEKMLYGAYYAYYCLLSKDAEPVVCRVCGSIPSSLFGDGTEDISCRLSSVVMAQDQTSKSEFSSDDLRTFDKEIACYYLGFLVFPSKFLKDGNPNKWKTFPPVVNTLARAENVYNTEVEKDTKLARMKSNNIAGSQKRILDEIFSGQLDPSNLPDALDDLTQLCTKLEINLTSNKSASARREAILTLYNSVTSGYSACHNTGDAKRSSGGWYTWSCKVTINVSFNFNQVKNIHSSAWIHLLLQAVEVQRILQGCSRSCSVTETFPPCSCL